MSDKNIIAQKLGILDVELARRCRSRITQHQAFITLYEEEHAKLKEEIAELWREYMSLTQLSRDGRELLWFHAQERRDLRAKIDDTEELIKWHREKIARIEECAQALDLTIED